MRMATVDYEMARKYLARQITNPLQAAAELARFTAARTLYAASGRLIPFNSNSTTGSTCTTFSTFVSTRGLMRI
jgi:hypothetical protein